MLEGKLVRLRAIEEKDVLFFHKWMNDPEITQYLMRYLPLTLKDSQDWFERKRKEEGAVHFTVEERKTRKPIGRCSLTDLRRADRNAGMVVFLGDKHFWGKGYGSEATSLLLSYGFDTLNLHRVTSAAADFNPRSIRMHEKLGFKREGVERERLFRHGKYCNLINFGLLREEFKRS